MPLHFILRDGVDIVVALPVSRLVAERLAALVAGRSGRLPLSITGLPRAVVFINHKARRRPGQRQPSRRLIGPTARPATRPFSSRSTFSRFSLLVLRRPCDQHRPRYRCR